MPQMVLLPSALRVAGHSGTGVGGASDRVSGMDIIGQRATSPRAERLGRRGRWSTAPALAYYAPPFLRNRESSSGVLVGRARDAKNPISQTDSPMASFGPIGVRSSCCTSCAPAGAGILSTEGFNCDGPRACGGRQRPDCTRPAFRGRSCAGAGVSRGFLCVQRQFGY